MRFSLLLILLAGVAMAEDYPGEMGVLQRELRNQRAYISALTAEVKRLGDKISCLTDCPPASFLNEPTIELGPVPEDAINASEPVQLEKPYGRK